MEGDVMEMSRDELQRWIRDNVKKEERIPTDQLESRLQYLLMKRQERAEQLVRLCQSVAECEGLVKKQYTLLGWEYRDIDSDDDDKSVSGNTSVSSVHSNNQTSYSYTSGSSTPLQVKFEDGEDYDRSRDFFQPKRKPVVVLTRLPESVMQSLHRKPAPQKHYDDHSVTSDDDEWTQPHEPDEDSTDSDFPAASIRKKRRIDRTSEKLAKCHETPRAKAISNGNNHKGTSATQNIEYTESNAATTSQTNDVTKGITVLTYIPTTAPLGEVTVNMDVVARKRAMQWLHGTVREIRTRDDGKVKYKIVFANNGKSLVSGHHLAFTSLPKAKQLFIGTRVVVKMTAEESQFCPGVIAELPDRKNRMRFLVFTDEGTPVYVGLPLFHMVCCPLNDPLDDMQDGSHKEFLRDYFKSWPFPLMSRYKVGQLLKAKLNGVQERCEVLELDCSIMMVAFQKGRHKEWMYRGSLRLEHVINMKQQMGK